MSTDCSLTGAVFIQGLKSRPELNGLVGDIISFDKVTKRCGVKIRGTTCNEIFKGGLLAIQPKNLESFKERSKEHSYVEKNREDILKQLAKHPETETPYYLKALQKGIEMSEMNYFDLVYYYFDSADRGKEVPPSIIENIHLRDTLEFFWNNSYCRTKSSPVDLACAEFQMTISPFLNETIEECTRYFREWVDANDFRVFFQLFCFSSDNKYGKDWPHQDHHFYRKIRYLWMAYCELRDNRETIFSRLNDYFLAKGIIEDFTASDLLWCFAVCFILKCKELRVMEHPRYNDYVRSDIKQKQLFEAAGTAVRERPDCPHSYLVAMHLYQDLQNATDDLAENRRRMRIQYEMARKGLDCCQAGDNEPFYLFVFHIHMAYILCTSGNPNGELRIGDRHQHAKLAKIAKKKCKSYMNRYHLERFEKIQLSKTFVFKMDKKITSLCICFVFLLFFQIRR